MEKKLGSNLFYGKYFTIPYVIDTIPYLPAGRQLRTQANKNVCVIAINVEDPITYQGALDELHCHQT